MATTTTITKFLFRRGNDSDRKQTILASGEPGLTLDTKRLWIGDGVTPGGIPALSAREYHLHYIDNVPGVGTGRQWTETDSDNSGAAQSLDINIPNLANTLAGRDRTAPIGHENLRWFHPVVGNIETTYDLRFKSEDAEIVHEGSGALNIYTSNNDPATTNAINIGGKILVRPDGITFKGPVDISGSDLAFTGVDKTHFSDKTIDINVRYHDPDTKNEPLSGGDGEDAGQAGFYISHMNYLSAGYIRVGDDNGDHSTFEFAPPMYYTNWESRQNREMWENKTYDNYIIRPTGRTPGSGKSTFTQNFAGQDSVFFDNPIPVSKPLVFHSYRPQDGELDFRGRSYKGNAHFVFEAGLMVYDSGDADIGAYNAYKINQSLDTRSAPTFTGIKIRKENGDPGAPMEVDSGGTGVNDFTTGSVLYTVLNHDDGSTDQPLQSMPLTQGSIMVGTNTKGVVSSKLNSSQWITFDYTDGTGSTGGQSDGVIKINNTFAPDFLQGDLETREKWFARFGTWACDTGSIIPVGTSSTDPREIVELRGDYSQAFGGTIRTVKIDSGVDNKGIQFEHNNLASEAWKSGSGEFVLPFQRGTGMYNMGAQTLFARGTVSNDKYFDELMPVTDVDDDDRTPATYRNTGLVIGGITLNQGGHVMGIRSKNLDHRYPQLFNLGTGGYFGDDQSPSDLSEAVHSPSGSSNTENSYLPVGKRTSDYGKNTRVMTGISFGDYGTVSGYKHHNLHDIFYDKSQVSSMVDTVDSRLDAIDQDLSNLGESSFLRNVNSYSATKITTGWYSGSEIHFSDVAYSSGQRHNKIYASADDWHFKPHVNSSISTYVGPNRHWEVRKLTGQDSDSSDSNDASMLMTKIYNTGTNSVLQDWWFDDKVRMRYQNGALYFKNTSGTDRTTISTESVTTQTMTCETGDVNGNLYLGENGGGDSNIYFYDDNSNGWRTFQWDDSFNDWRVEDNGGTMRTLLHTGNIANNINGLKAGDSAKLNGQPASYYATATHNHTYNVNDSWLRENGDNNYFKIYGNTRQVVMRTDGTTQYSNNGAYPFVWLYNGDDASKRLMILNTSGQIWGKAYGWLHDYFLPMSGGTITGNLTVEGTIYGEGDVIAYHSSDAKFKDNLKPIENALEKTLSLTGYEFDWNNKQDVHQGHDVGVVAQEVEQVLPEIVETRSDDSKAVRYEKIIPLLIQSIKELTEQVEHLKSQIK
jgi:hypothetical protein